MNNNNIFDNLLDLKDELKEYKEKIDLDQEFTFEQSYDIKNKLTEFEDILLLISSSITKLSDYNDKIDVIVERLYFHFEDVENLNSTIADSLQELNILVNKIKEIEYVS